MTDKQKREFYLKVKNNRTTEKTKEYNKKAYGQFKNLDSVERKRRTDAYRRVQKENPLYRLRCNLRGRFKEGFLKYRTTKKDSTKNMLGCSWSFFVSWIESKFNKKMTWQNYGQFWHIDHIQPLASFDLTNRDEVLKAWHYTNLRPLEAKENIMKSDRIITHQPELVLVLS
jgi:hypothetical protein